MKIINKIQEKVYSLSKKLGKKIGLDLPYFIKNGFWVSLRQIITIIAGLILYISFARFLSKEVFGQYQLIISIWSIVSICSISGLNTSISAAVANGSDGNYQSVVKKSFLWSIIGIPILWIIGFYYIKESFPLGISLLVTSIIFPFFYAFNTWDSFLQGKALFDISAKYFSIQSIVNTLFSVLAILFYKDNLLVIATIYLGIFALFNVLFYQKSLKYINNNNKDPDVDKYGFFLTKISALGIVADNVDKIILATFLSPVTLAAYSIVSLIPIKLRESVKPLLSILFPKFIITNEDLWQLLKNKRAIVLFFGIVILILSVFYYFFIVKLCLLLFGTNYTEYYSYSKYFVLFIILYIPQNMIVRYVYAKKMNAVIVFSDTVYYITKIILSFTLIFKYGLFGAVVAFNLSFFVWVMAYVVSLAIRKKYFAFQ
ncbi:MAG: oligosaccharide flippase family protein [Parcubacteria group bacterium]|jgi:O-antigen/teichoic acid export membrane protein